MNPEPSRQSIAVVGGGITGIAAALELTKSGLFNVTLLEKRDHLGGMSAYFQWKDVIWDRFYHVILSTDTAMLEFISELGLEKELFWRETKSGFYRDGRLVSMSSITDFIRFPFMTLWQKFRLGMGILYSTRIKDPSRLASIYASEWLKKVFGRKVYLNIWNPLLRSKLGDASERTSAAFIWATINRLYGARSSDKKQEKMGHVHGGYKRILEAAEKKLKQAGVAVLTNHSVENVIIGNKSNTSVHVNNLTLKTSNGSFVYDKVLLTVDCPTILKLIPNGNQDNYWSRLGEVEYLGVICVLLILKRKLSSYYVINLLDRHLPFTGIIEATNILSPDEIGGRHIIYLPKYLSEPDLLNHMPDKEIKVLFLSGLKKVYPNLMDDDILHCEISRERYVQPLQEFNYLNRTFVITTPLSNLYMVNTSMIYNSTLNNNAAITLAKKTAKCVIDVKGKNNEVV